VVAQAGDQAIDQLTVEGLQRCSESGGCSVPHRIRLRRGARWHRRELDDMPVAPVWSIPNDATSFLGQHISATFELRAGVVKAEARRVERSESLDDVEHSSTLIV
jgi:hypothetical protein